LVDEKNQGPPPGRGVHQWGKGSGLHPSVSENFSKDRFDGQKCILLGGRIGVLRGTEKRGYSAFRQKLEKRDVLLAPRPTEKLRCWKAGFARARLFRPLLRGREVTIRLKEEMPGRNGKDL